MISRAIRNTFTVVLIAIFSLPATGQVNDVREFLRTPDPQIAATAVNRQAVELARHQYFSKPGRFETYSFDISALEREGEEITITPLGGAPITILSHGLNTKPQTRGHTATWTGELKLENPDQVFPLKWRLAVRSVDKEGNVRRRDPNREVTRKLIEQDAHVVLQESYDRRDEKLVYALLRSTIPLPDRSGRLILKSLGTSFDSEDQFHTIMVYEADPEKALLIGDHPIGNGPQKDDPSSELRNREARRRLANYEAHMAQVMRNLGLEE